ELDDINRSAGSLEFGVKFRIEAAEADTDAERRFASQCFDERDHHFANNDRIFTSLHVEVGDAWRPMMNGQFGEFVVPRAETGKAAVVAAHSTMGAVLTAEIGVLD